MIIAIDVQYGDRHALAAGLLFKDWTTDAIALTLTKKIHQIAPYEPGSFYKRELPCILSLLEDIDHDLQTIVVDGFVTLGANNKPGLGMHLYKSLDTPIPVIGVAKRKFAGTPDECQVFRGESQNPLFITAVGIPLAQAKSHIQFMHGDHRIPTLLKKVDQLCRGQTI